MLIVLSGLPGTGKSAIADGIARARQTPVLSVDPIESAIVRAGIPRDDVERRRAEWTKWPEPHLTLDASDPPDVNLAKALDYVARPSN